MTWKITIRFVNLEFGVAQDGSPPWKARSSTMPLSVFHITVPHYGAYLTKKNLVEIMYPPIPSMYGIYLPTCGGFLMGNVDKYTIHSYMDATG